MKAPERDKRKGLLACYTGDGKGKSTAAFGSILRAIGYGWKVCVIQFMKGSWKYGEMEGFKQLRPKVEFHRKGLGFYKIIDDKLPEEDHKRAAAEAIQFSVGKITSGEFDLVILDELNVSLQTGLISVEDAIELLKKKPDWLHLIITGRGAPKEIIEMCDLVTEMKEIKHPYQSGILARKDSITKAKKRGISINAILNAEMDPAIVKKCRHVMYGEFGHLGDIPHELANTIANIYYEFFKIDKDLQKEGIPKDYFKSENIFDDLGPFARRIRRNEFKLNSMRDLIPYLREIDKDKQPNLYKLWLSVSYDILKYDIPNTMKKVEFEEK